MITDLSVKDVAPVPPFATVTVSERVDPAAVTVIFPVPSNDTPFMVLDVANAVAVAAFPVVS